MLEVHRRQRVSSTKARRKTAVTDDHPFGTVHMYRAFFKMAASHGDEEMCRQLVRMAEEDMIPLDEQMVGHICRAIADGAREVPPELRTAAGVAGIQSDAASPEYEVDKAPVQLCNCPCS